MLASLTITCNQISSTPICESVCLSTSLSACVCDPQGLSVCVSQCLSLFLCSVYVSVCLRFFALCQFVCVPLLCVCLSQLTQRTVQPQKQRTQQRRSTRHTINQRVDSGVLQHAPAAASHAIPLLAALTVRLAAPMPAIEVHSRFVYFHRRIPTQHLLFHLLQDLDPCQSPTELFHK